MEFKILPHCRLLVTGAVFKATSAVCWKDVHRLNAMAKKITSHNGDTGHIGDALAQKLQKEHDQVLNIVQAMSYSFIRISLPQDQTNSGCAIRFLARSMPHTGYGIMLVKTSALLGNSTG